MQAAHEPEQPLPLRNSASKLGMQVWGALAALHLAGYSLGDRGRFCCSEELPAAQQRCGQLASLTYLPQMGILAARWLTFVPKGRHGREESSELQLQ